MLKSISVKQLSNVSDGTIIDIRSIEKFNNSHINGSINIPNEELINNCKKYLDRNKKYYIYCQYGKTSIKTCIFLDKQGYNVTNILGGYEAWILKD